MDMMVKSIFDSMVCTDQVTGGQGILAGVLVPHEQVSPCQRDALPLGLLPDVHLDTEDCWEWELLPRGPDGLVIILQNIDLHISTSLALCI